MKLSEAFEAVIDRCRTDDGINERDWNHVVLRVKQHMRDIIAEEDAKLSAYESEIMSKTPFGGLE